MILVKLLITIDDVNLLKLINTVDANFLDLYDES
jgi:hypothetical protein